MSDDFLNKRRAGNMDPRPGRSGQKKQKPIPKRSEKGIIRTEDKKTLVKQDMVFYLEIWMKRKHVDFETGKPLPNKATIQNFHHVLEKAQFPEYRHSEWNIVLVDWETHDKIHRNIDNTPKIKALTELLTKQHEAGTLKP